MLAGSKSSFVGEAIYLRIFLSFRGEVDILCRGLM
jgi:hypothetical protein